jgi:hypothetical protein
MAKAHKGKAKNMLWDTLAHCYIEAGISLEEIAGFVGRFIAAQAHQRGHQLGGMPRAQARAARKASKVGPLYAPSVYVYPWTHTEHADCWWCKHKDADGATYHKPGEIKLCTRCVKALENGAGLVKVKSAKAGK